MKTGKTKLPKAGHHAQPKPRLRTRHLSSTGKSAYAPGPGGAGAVPAFPPGPAGAGAPAFPDPGAGGADSAALAGPSGGATSGAPGM